MKDTFQTIAYKSGFIHLCNDRTMEGGYVRSQLSDGTRNTHRSIQAAKIFITRCERGNARAAILTPSPLH